MILNHIVLMYVFLKKFFVLIFCCIFSRKFWTSKWTAKQRRILANIYFIIELQFIQLDSLDVYVMYLIEKVFHLPLLSSWNSDSLKVILISSFHLIMFVILIVFSVFINRIILKKNIYFSLRKMFIFEKKHFKIWKYFYDVMTCFVNKKVVLKNIQFLNLNILNSDQLIVI